MNYRLDFRVQTYQPIVYRVTEMILSNVAHRFVLLILLR